MKRERLTDRLQQKQAAAGARREIPDGYKYNKKKIKHLKHVLHNVNVSLGCLVSALNEFSRIKGPDISPDGLLGGLGYILPVKGVKEVLNNSVRSLSDIADSLADELTNPHWNAEDDAEVKKLLKEKEDVEEKIEEVEEVEDQAQPEDPGIMPEDVITSQDEDIKIATDAFAKTVRKNLVRFSSVGNRKNISKES